MRKVKPLNDFIFKKIFGEKGNEDILISFINAVLKRTNKEPIIEIEIIDNKQLTKEVINDKTGIIDVRARTAKGENIKQGEDYTSLEKVITINILDFDYLKTESYQSSFYLWEDIEKDYMLTDMVEIHFLELPKFRRKQNKNYKNNAIERWLAFLEKDIPEATLKELMDFEPAIEKAEKRIEYLSSDEETMNTYWERERSLHERANMINSAEQRGKEEGINLTKKVFKLAATGEPISNIANICGISEDEVKEILE